MTGFLGTVTHRPEVVSLTLPTHVLFPGTPHLWRDRHLSLVLATPAGTCSEAWASQTPHMGHSSRTVLSALAVLKEVCFQTQGTASFVDSRRQECTWLQEEWTDSLKHLL